MSGENSERPDRPVSVSSSSAETAIPEDNEKLAARLDHRDHDLEELKSPDDLEIGDDHEDDGLLPQQDEKPKPPKSTFASSLTWMVVNTLATIGIVRCV